MKSKIMFHLILVAFFVLTGRAFGKEGLKQSTDGPGKTLPTYMMEKTEELIEPAGTEIGDNTYYGDGAGLNSSGDYSSFFGYRAGKDNTRDYSTCVGSYAGFLNQGYNTCFFGYRSGEDNQGNDNSFFGAMAGSNQSGGDCTGEENTFIGNWVGAFNKSGSFNTSVGAQSGVHNQSGGKNTIVGYRAGFWNQGNWNTFNGSQAGYSNSTGYWNTCIGFETGFNNQTGSYNVFLGSKAGHNETGSHKLYIDSTDTDKPLIWGDFYADNVVINGGFRAIAISSPSDERLKRNIKPLESSLDKINGLQGVSYEWKIDEYPDVGMMEGKQIGLVAQNVEKVLPELVSEDKDGYKAVSYTKLTAVLVEAVKELKSKNQSQKKLIEEQWNQFKKQQAEIEELRSMIRELKS